MRDNPSDKEASGVYAQENSIENIPTDSSQELTTQDEITNEIFVDHNTNLSPKEDTLLGESKVALLDNSPSLVTPETPHKPINSNSDIQQDFNCHCNLFNNELGNTLCPLCNQPIKPLLLLQQQSSLLQSQLNSLTVDLNASHTQQTEFLQIITSLENKCVDATDTMNDKILENVRLRADLHVMGEKLLDEVEKRAELQHAKEAFQDELEELSKSLFEQANGLVAHEARKRDFHEKREHVLERENEALKLMMEDEREQLRELKLKLSELMVSNHNATNNNHLDNQGDQHEKHTLKEQPLTKVEDKLDCILLADFQHFITVAPITKLPKLTSIPFLKLSIEEDVEPCLKFGNNPKTNTKKLLETIMSNSCYIEQIPLNCLQYSTEPHTFGSPDLQTNSPKLIPPTSTIFTKSISERLSTSFSLFSSATSVPPLKLPSLNPTLTMCSTCAKPFNCTFHFKTTTAIEDIWYPICTSCKDRFITVCDFFAFVKQVQLEMFKDKGVAELYVKCLLLKRNMFHARVGAFGCMEREGLFGDFAKRFSRGPLSLEKRDGLAIELGNETIRDVGLAIGFEVEDVGLSSKAVDYDVPDAHWGSEVNVDEIIPLDEGVQDLGVEETVQTLEVENDVQEVVTEEMVQEGEVDTDADTEDEIVLANDIVQETEEIVPDAIQEDILVANLEQLDNGVEKGVQNSHRTSKESIAHI